MNKRAYWKKEKEKVSNCRKTWKYADLEKTESITVLLYNAKMRFHLFSFPNFIIGENQKGDTIAVMDRHFEGKLKQGDKITIEPYLWTETEKNIIKPLFTVHKKSKENNLYCSIKKVFYGRIKN
jgi:hypothetical protein